MCPLRGHHHGEAGCLASNGRTGARTVDHAALHPVIDAYPRLDVLVNNAGYGVRGRVAAIALRANPLGAAHGIDSA